MSVTPVLAPFITGPACGSCSKPIDASNFLVTEVPAGDLPRMVALLSGRMPDQSDPGEVVASYTLARDNGVRVGSVIRVPLLGRSQAGAGHAGQAPALRVVGIVAAENEFPAGTAPRYDLYATTAFGAEVNQRARLLSLDYVRLRHGAADLSAFDSRLRSLGVLGTDDLDTNAAIVQASIRPQAVGWWLLAGLAALAGLAVIGQAVGRQAATERADHAALSALGTRPRELVLVGLLRSLGVAVAGAAGAVLLATLLSPLTPLGEARLASADTGRVSFDPLILLLGALGTVVAVVALSARPAVRHARLLGGREPPRTAPVPVVKAVALTGAPPSVLIGVRYALERSRGAQPIPVGTALLGTVMAVAALCATAVFGASLTHLVSSPALYGTPYQVYFATNGDPGSEAVVTGPLLDSLRRDSAIKRITLAALVEVGVNGKRVRAIAVTAVRGPALISAVDGHRPGGDQQIVLGAATMRSTGARLGVLARVTVADPSGVPHETSFRVVGRASMNAGTGGLGNGAVMTTSAFVSAQCPAGPKQSTCQDSVQSSLGTVVLVRAAPGAAGNAALTQYVGKYPTLTYLPAKPTVLVNFGESVNFPLLFALALSVFGAATLLHLLLVSVARRRVEAGLLKALGFVRRQVAAAVCWQATAVALVGIAVGAPAGIATGKVLWRVFATNFGVVPVSVVHLVPLAVLAALVLVAAIVLACVPALVAARSRPARLLRAE
jgi:ABC-type lipoprotein release transport system permease subunit